MKLRKLNKHPVHSGPNMTPMVDIVMCILIFFMLGSTFVVPDLFLRSTTPAIDKTGLGQQASSLALPPVQSMINLTQVDGYTRVRAFGVAIDRLDPAGIAALSRLLTAKQTALSPDVHILIAPDKSVPYQDVITIYDQCIAARFKYVAFVAPG